MRNNEAKRLFGIRKYVAKKMNYTADYFVFTDKVLWDIWHLRPKTKRDLLSVRGFNEKQYSLCGNRIISVFGVKKEKKKVYKKKREGKTMSQEKEYQQLKALRRAVSINSIELEKKLADFEANPEENDIDPYHECKICIRRIKKSIRNKRVYKRKSPKGANQGA